MAGETEKPKNKDSARAAAYRLIVLMGTVSLFGDITYEGARSITGPYLAVLGAGATIVGIVSGLGDFLGYALRLVSGYVADRTRSYWALTFTGYGLMLAIPALAFTGNWKLAAALIVLERIGKAIRTPARDTILSHAAKQVGRGWGFGLHEFMDQVGAVMGPVIFTMVFLFKGNYGEGFKILLIPALLSILLLARAAKRMPNPHTLEVSEKYRPFPGEKEMKALPRLFWFYALFTFFSVAGMAHFQLIAFHIKARGLAPDALIPVLYIVDMAVAGGVALIMGRLYDKAGLRFLVAAPLACLPVAWLSFTGGYAMALLGVAFLGVVIGSHETIMRAAIADLTAVEKRGFAYGVFNMVYGLAYLAGGVTMGVLYDRLSISGLVVYSAAMEASAILIFLLTGFPRMRARH